MASLIPGPDTPAYSGPSDPLTEHCSYKVSLHPTFDPPFGTMAKKGAPQYTHMEADEIASATSTVCIMCRREG